MKKSTIYYFIAVVVIFIWSITFISTKTLLNTLSPSEIMFYRYIIAYISLILVYPKFNKSSGIKEESLFLLAGIFGGTIYFLAENYALKFSLASNVGLLVASAPLLTALVAHIFMKEEKASKRWYIGATIAFGGVFLVVFNGQFVLKLNPLGDFLAILAAFSWAIYSILIKKIGNIYNAIYITRKVFFYSIITMIPTLFFTDFKFELATLLDIRIISNILFLGILASSICFVLWNKVILYIGAVKANNFVYLIPFITMIASAIILDEPIKFIAILGGILIIFGVYVSEYKKKDFINKKYNIKSNNSKEVLLK